MSILAWPLGSLVVLLALSAFFSSSETALFSLSRSRLAALEYSGRSGNRLVVRLLRTPRRLLITILVGNTLVNIAAASLATAVAITLLQQAGQPQAMQQGMLGATLVMTILLLLVGEIVPKSFAIEKAEFLAPLVAGPLVLFAIVVAPVRVVLEQINNLLINRVAHLSPAGPALSSGEIATAVDLGHYAGVVDAFERVVVNNILDLDARAVADVMTPRVEVVSLDRSSAPEGVGEIFRESGFSRLPVVDGDLDRVLGILYAKDWLAARATGDGFPDFRTLLREPFFVPDSMKMLDLLAAFRDRRLHLALGIDEYGSVSGVVTMEDLLEEIVGDIADSRDQEEAPFKLLAPGIAVVYAGWDLEEFGQATGFDLNDPHAETVGGWLINRLGRIPISGETVDTGPFRVHVLSARPTRVLWLRVQWRAR